MRLFGILDGGKFNYILQCHLGGGQEERMLGLRLMSLCEECCAVSSRRYDRRVKSSTLVKLLLSFERFNKGHNIFTHVPRVLYDATFL